MGSVQTVPADRRLLSGNASEDGAGQEMARMATGKQRRLIYRQGIIIYGNSSFIDLAASPKRGEDRGGEKKWAGWEARGRGIPQDLVTLGSLD